MPLESVTLGSSLHASHDEVITSAEDGLVFLYSLKSGGFQKMGSKWVLDLLSHVREEGTHL